MATNKSYFTASSIVQPGVVRYLPEPRSVRCFVSETECKNGTSVIYLENQNDTFWSSKLIELRWNYARQPP